MLGIAIVILGVILTIVSYQVTQNDINKSRRYMSLSAGTLSIILGFYIYTSYIPVIHEKISIDDIKTKVKLFSQPD